VQLEMALQFRGEVAIAIGGTEQAAEADDPRAR
jgi:hypothetical protein